MKKIIKIVLLLVFSLSIVFSVYAKTISSSDETIIKNEVKDFFDEVKNLDVDAALAVAGYKLADNTQMKYIKDFFKEYPDSETQCKEMLNKISCEVIEIKTDENNNSKINCKLKISYPNFQAIVKKAKASIILNNLVDFLKGNITNKNVASIINSIYKEFNKNNYDMIDSNVNIKLKKQGDKFIVYDINELISNIQKFVSEYSKSVMGEKKWL